MAILGYELEEIARLIRLIEEGDLDEIVLEEEGRSVRLRGPEAVRESASRSQGVPVAASRPVTSPTALPSAEKRRALSAGRESSQNGNKASAAHSADLIELVAPMVGTFYRSEKPGASALIEVGQRIAIGQTIGLIEAMKVFSEVPAEHAGVVSAIPIKDGSLVHPGTPLVILRKE